ncbi:hypothetical protein N658DRAFT_562095 [Parathielavia hyrcaniae]|uniref:Alpha-ketoglutarate-dependent sulfonate dioxygenase n=1 Tax=Parathielavia hyrcaniae TaxID=113614 RepID=A0AAN6PS75_9PEZI|nr:hypothetical protein N658DRAFT_562095 [Parathielavia hyrcaniae]
MPDLESTNSPNRHSDSTDGPPPPYTAIGAPPDAHHAHEATEAEAVSLTAAFSNLALSDLPVDPSVDTCLAHLKLLFAIQWIKEDVGFADGLWGLWDAQAGPVDPVLKRRPEKGEKEKNEPRVARAEERLRNENLKTLSLIREKRWALFVAKAVHRYETWWKALMDTFLQRPLTEADMEIPGLASYAGFPTDRQAVLQWKENMLPPLDVLMVWHTHMLNPRAFLEDAMLAGLRDFWNTGMPWSLVDNAIDTDFNYTVSDECRANWTRKTGLAWNNEDDPLTKKLECPGCNTWMHFPWTTCGLPEHLAGREPLGIKRGDKPLDLTGHGLGDGDPTYICPGCGVVIRKETLSVAKFVDDFRLLLGPKNRPMPGTVLCPRTGKPTTPSTPTLPSAHSFPNRLLKSDWNSVRSKILCLTTFRENQDPTMDDVRKAIEAFLASPSSVPLINGVISRKGYQLPVESRIAVRKMMSRYWENSSFFALDLCGAVMRQGVFVEKMCRLDWLHSPTARDTMARLLTKYGRFIYIMQASKGQLAVPTLDVDLAWHTHQLSPSKYYQYTVTKVARFVDHDDKVEETKLSEQFEWTSKMYQEIFGEVYSECTCWYCETIRSEHITGIEKVTKVFGLSKQGKIAETFHTSGAASLHPPSTSAHISSHPAVKPTYREKSPYAHRLVHQVEATRLNQRLNRAYAKACARAEKKGRPPPKRDDDVYYDHWGYPFLYSAPFMFALWWTPGMYLRPRRRRGDTGGLVRRGLVVGGLLLGLVGGRGDAEGKAPEGMGFRVGVGVEVVAETAVEEEAVVAEAAVGAAAVFWTGLG